MPRGDGRGPDGMGSMTGRGAGYCAGYPGPGFANPDPRGGRAFGGRGWRHMYYATGLPGWARYASPAVAGGQIPFPQASQPGMGPEQEKEFLENQARILGKQLEEVKKRLGDIEEDQS